jgi:putative transposase
MKKLLDISEKSLLKKSIDEIIKEGVQTILQQALEIEIEEFIDRYSNLKAETGKKRIVRNGYQNERSFQTKAGSMRIRVPRARDKSESEYKIRFSSRLIPPYLRRTKEINEFIPFLYLKGISTGDFSEVLTELLGDEVSISPATVVKLKEIWREEYKRWNNRDLSGKRYIYWWADGIYFNVRLDDDKTCILVIIGATTDGKKELIAIEEGYRESEISWKNILLDLKKLGLSIGPSLATGDGSLGFWNALAKEFPGTRHQRCWVHRMANILDKMPKSVQTQAKRNIQEIYMSPTKADALKAFEKFISLYEYKYAKAVECLLKTKVETMAFYDFPEEHWKHIRTTNPIESTFATVRLRTYKTKGSGSRMETLTMVFKLVESAEKKWQKINCREKILLVLEGKKFVNGVLQNAA